MANVNFTCVLDAWREGTTLYGRMHYYRSGSYYYEDSAFPNPTMNLGGTTYTDTAFGDRVRSGIYVGDVYTTTFSRTVSGTGTRTVTFSAGSGQRSDFAGTWSVDVGGFPGTYTAPNQPTVSIVSSTSNSVTVSYGTTSFGNPSSGTVYLYGGTSNSPTTQIASKTTTGNSNYQHTGLVGNTKYYYRARAKNSQLWSSYSNGYFSVTTAGPVTNVNAEVLSATSIKIDYITAAGGGNYRQEIQYSLDNGVTWTTGNTVPVSTTAATPGSFNITGLQSNTTYQIQIRVKTNAGSSTSVSTTATTLPSAVMYGSVNGETKLIKKLYGSVNGETKLIKKLYGSVNGQTKRIF